MERVVIGSLKEYDPGSIREFLETSLRETDFSIRDAKVLLKPNLLSGKSPEKAVTTHPAIVRAVAELLIDRGCEVHIGDSPGYESTEKALKLSGITHVIEELGLTIASFDNKIIKEIDGISPYKRFMFGKDPGAFDAVINLPKFKSHTMMGLTLGVKNTFGFIPGKEKARWHLRAGKDRLMFALLLMDIHTIVRPSLTIMDGIVGMDGEGPSSGRARNFGLIALAKDAYALDKEMERLVGLSSPLPITRMAQKHGLIGEYEVKDLGAPVIDGFEMAKVTDTDWALPEFAKRILKNFFVRKPKLRAKLCKGCGLCVTVCPAEALGLSPEGLPVFDYKACIRCYCCQEMCPEGSIRV